MSDERGDGGASPQVDTRGYPAGSEEYPLGNEGHEGHEGHEDGGEPFWKHDGFESLEAYLAENENSWNRMMGLPTRDLEGLSAEEILFHKPEPRERLSRRPASPRMRSRQVNVKLREQEHARLCEAAEPYGLPPATMARILLMRGVRAVLEDREAG